MVANMSKKKLNNFILLPLFLGAVTLVAAGALTGVHLLTEPKIEENIKQKQLSGYKAVLDLAQSDVIDLKKETVSDELAGIGVTNKFSVTIDTTLVGVVYDAEITGYNSGLIFQVGFKGTKYAGFNVISSNETPGYGADYLETVHKQIKGVEIGDPILQDPSKTGKTITANALRKALEACATDYLEGRAG